MSMSCSHGLHLLIRSEFYFWVKIRLENIKSLLVSKRSLSWFTIPFAEITLLLWLVSLLLLDVCVMEYLSRDHLSNSYRVSGEAYESCLLVCLFTCILRLDFALASSAEELLFCSCICNS